MYSISQHCSSPQCHQTSTSHWRSVGWPHCCDSEAWSSWKSLEDPHHHRGASFLQSSHDYSYVGPNLEILHFGDKKLTINICKLFISSQQFSSLTHILPHESPPPSYFKSLTCDFHPSERNYDQNLWPKFFAFLAALGLGHIGGKKMNGWMKCFWSVRYISCPGLYKFAFCHVSLVQ